MHLAQRCELYFFRGRISLTYNTQANLDVQYAGSISYPTQNIYYSTGGSPPFVPDSATPTNTNEPYLNWLEFILNQTSIPQTISTSYGDDEQTVPEDYARSVCDLFAQLGAKGVSVLFSSGDAGVGDGSCLSNDDPNRTQFIPIFPASCEPFVSWFLQREHAIYSIMIYQAPSSRPLEARIK
jgi:tripeptidyl-peptidase-1